jgi:succinoglycan biosynthesis protein ExoA
MKPDISIICPVFNEAAYLPNLLSFLAMVKPLNKEIIFIDGGSTDGSEELIKACSISNKSIKYYHNPNKTVPFALNIGIENASADIISRIDAHSVYADDYFEKILETFANVKADGVGGPTRTAFTNPFQEAVGYAISSKMGVGSSKVHQLDFEGYTDSVTFGAWKKEIFQTVGMFDERFKRNQDDEFHYRLGAAGFKVYQNPEIKIFYYPRSSVRTLFKQYFQYGLYKPLVLKKVKTGRKLRHYVPSIFVVYLLITLPLIINNLQLILVSPLLLYIGLSLIFTFKSGVSIVAKFSLPLIFSSIHIAYGLGFIVGLVKLRKLSEHS